MESQLPPPPFMREPPLVAMAREVHFTFQPIVSGLSGLCYGFEAAACGLDRLGFPTLAALYDHAHEATMLGAVELALRERAVHDFHRFARKGERLLIGVDRRSLMVNDLAARTTEMLARWDLHPSSLCLALSETQLAPGTGVAGAGLNAYRRRSYLLALDHFGAGAAGLKPLYEHQPNLIRIDRGFFESVVHDERKKLFLTTVVNLARVLGITVIADGVDTEAEFRTAIQLGCELVQGEFVGPATGVAGAFTRSSSVVADSHRRERRERRGDQRLLREELARLSPLHVMDSMAKLFHAFRSQKDHGFLPIVDDQGHPLGIVREIDLKDVIYSRYGKDLLHNKALHRGLLDFMRPCPVCDINTEAEGILEIFSKAVNPLGILVVDDFEYVGVLTAASLLRVVNEKNLALARDQNPLTRLPGNNSINDHIEAALKTTDSAWVFAYFDLDNFKPFNDRFGFRQGDRAILLFSEIMRANLGNAHTFLGHIGGDDFFASFRDMTPDQVRERVESALTAFRRDVESFYDAEARELGYILGRSRDGEPRRFPLLSCSAALVEIPMGERLVGIDEIGDAIATLKKEAKSAPDHIAVRPLG